MTRSDLLLSLGSTLNQTQCRVALRSLGIELLGRNRKRGLALGRRSLGLKNFRDRWVRRDFHARRFASFMVKKARFSLRIGHDPVIRAVPLG